MNFYILTTFYCRYKLNTSNVMVNVMSCAQRCYSADPGWVRGYLTSCCSSLLPNRTQSPSDNSPPHSWAATHWMFYHFGNIVCRSSRLLWCCKKSQYISRSGNTQSSPSGGCQRQCAPWASQHFVIGPTLESNNHLLSEHWTCRSLECGNQSYIANSKRPTWVSFKKWFIQMAEFGNESTFLGGDSANHCHTVLPRETYKC